MKPKVMDMNTDWETIKNEQLTFVNATNVKFNRDFRYASVDEEQKTAGNNQNGIDDRRDEILKALVMIGGFN